MTNNNTIHCPNCHAEIIDVDHFWGLCDKCLGFDKLPINHSVTIL